MATISLCMIIKNEEDILSRCLDSVSELVDEIIIVDTGSSDNSIEVAEKYTDKVYTIPWNDDFAAARNFSFSLATMEYCMWLDADDILEPSERKQFLHLKQSLAPDIDIVMMKYHTAFDSSGKPAFSYYRERWIRNNSGYNWMGEVHEVIPPSGSLYYTDIAISHKKLKVGNQDRNLNIYRKILSEKKVLDLRQQYYYGRELYYHGLYQDAIPVFNQFLDSPGGWVENKIEACAVCADCYYHIQQESSALKVLLRSLEFDVPRAELCCDIGKYFFEHGNYKCSVYWYETALKAERNDKTGGFILPDCYDYIPFLQLCVCYDRIGDRKKAEEYNEKVGKCKPDSKAYLYNKRYFGSTSA